MKKVKLLLVLLTIVSFFPLNAIAEDLNIGVTIQGQVIISAVTTINTNVVVDVNLKHVQKSFIKVENTGNADLNFQIIDIAPADANSPANFVAVGQTGPVEGKTWASLSEADTKNYIAFGISYGDVDYQSILPDTTVSLGNVKFLDESMGAWAGVGQVPNAKAFVLTADTGYLWGSTTSLSYNITTLVQLGAAETEISRNLSKHEVEGFTGDFAPGIYHDYETPLTNGKYTYKGYVNFQFENFETIGTAYEVQLNGYIIDAAGGEPIYFGPESVNASLAETQYGCNESGCFQAQALYFTEAIELIPSHTYYVYTNARLIKDGVTLSGHYSNASVFVVDPIE